MAKTPPTDEIHESPNPRSSKNFKYDKLKDTRTKIYYNHTTQKKRQS